MKTLVLATGGIDSTACINFMLSHGHEVRAMHVDFGQDAAKWERKALAKVGSYFGVDVIYIDINSPKKFSAGEIVGRNAFLLFLALLYKDAAENIIVIGVHSGTNYMDCSRMFIEQSSKLVADYTDGKSLVFAPFVDWVKKDVYEYCTKEKLPIEMTYSCENGDELGCGKCLSCLDRGRFYVG